MKALIPAIPICASEIWPTYPVMITTEKQMHAVISEESSAARYWGSDHQQRHDPYDPPEPARGRGGMRGAADRWIVRCR